MTNDFYIEVDVLGQTYGYVAQRDIDTGKADLSRLNSRSKIFKWQEYRTRNGRALRRKIRVRPSHYLYQSVVQAMLSKYSGEAAQ
jgi:hypothetical protein